MLYKASDAATAVLVLIFGVLTVPAGAAMGIGLKNKLSSWYTPIRAGVSEGRDVGSTRPAQLERRLQERLDALGPVPRAELLTS